MIPRIFVSLGLSIILFSAFSTKAFGEAKAYDLIKYEVKVGRLTFALDYGAGYIEASEMRITEAGKTTRFRLNDSDEMQFVPDKKTSGDKKIILKLGRDDPPPAKIEGTYTAGGRTIAFVLVQK